MFVNKTHPQLIQMPFPCFSQYLKFPSRYVYVKLHKNLGFDGPKNVKMFVNNLFYV